MTRSEIELLKRVIAFPDTRYNDDNTWIEERAQALEIINRELNLKTMDVTKSVEDDKRS